MDQSSVATDTAIMDNRPWQAIGSEVRDASGRLVALATSQEAAKLMAAAPRMSSILWLALDMKPWHHDDWPSILERRGGFFESARSVLLEAGEDPPHA